MTDVKNLSCTFTGRSMRATIENTEDKYKSFDFECVFADQEGVEYRLASTAGVDAGETIEVATDEAPKGKEIIKVVGKSLVEKE